MTSPELPQPEARHWIARAFTVLEDVVYIGLGVLLGACALTLLVATGIDFARAALDGSLPRSIPTLLAGMLLVLLVVELLYTVQVSFREHKLLPEPFLLVGLISAIRRVLVLTAEVGELKEHTEATFRHFVIELLVITVFVVALSLSLLLLRKAGEPLAAKR